MRDFAYSRAGDLVGALEALAEPDATVIAGGTELLNWLRLGIANPARLVDVGRVHGLDDIERDGDRLRIGALATLNQVGEHPLVVEHAQVLSQACLKAASAQVRNRATIGGNMLQKTRCEHFRSEAPLPWGCNKRAPGSGCAAIEGLNDRHALFGWTDACVAVHPADPPVALAALEAIVEVSGTVGAREIPLSEFHVTQLEANAMKVGSDAARLETRLAAGEIITGVSVPIVPGQRSAYVKVRERESYHYALVSAAAALVLDGDRIARARVALGSVAQKPWRLPGAEAALAGKRPIRDDVLPVMQAALEGAMPLSRNGYKVALAANAATRAILLAVAPS